MSDDIRFMPPTEQEQLDQIGALDERIVDLEIENTMLRRQVEVATAQLKAAQAATLEPAA